MKSKKMKTRKTRKLKTKKMKNKKGGSLKKRIEKSIGYVNSFKEYFVKEKDNRLKDPEIV